MRRVAAPDPRPRVLFVEDERSISGPFSRALAREGFDPVVAHTAAEAHGALREREPDIVLLDITLPDGDGRDICRELRRRSDVPIIMLTARGTEIERVVGLELGADDYVVKPFSGAEVIARHAGGPAARAAGRDARAPGGRRRRPARRRPGGAAGVAGRRRAGPVAQGVRPAGRAGARTPATVVTREDLMSRVWDENWFGSTKTLDVHIGWLRGKLGDDAASPRFIHTVRGVGFRFTAPGEWPP